MKARRGKLAIDEAPAENGEGIDLCVKYRPTKWADVLGQVDTVKSIRSVLERGDKRAFVLVGGSGTGKTTIARIMARKVGCGDQGYREIDAATNTGIDAMRLVAEGMMYKPFGGEKKLICVDEAHALSKPAWQSLLKIVEEPPAHGYWVFCTTEGGKIPETIQTRCACYTLAPVGRDDLTDFLARVNAAEGYGVPEPVLAFLGRTAGGSVRRALTGLAQCLKAETPQDAASLLRTAGGAPEIVELARGLVNGQLTWAKAMRILRDKADTNPESIRVMIVAYLNKVLAGAKDEKAAGRVTEILDAFLPGPCYQGNGLAEVYAALAQVLL
jgi:DNA polymerase III gamma/tau subunit